MHLPRILAILLGLCAVSACNGDRETADARERPALWEIRAADGRNEGWLFGTIHALPGGVRWRTPLLDHSVANSDLLIVEVAQLHDAEALTAPFEALAFDRHEGPLEGRVAARLHGRLATLRHRAGPSAARLDAMESWAAALTLARLGQAGDPANGADRALLDDFEDRRVVELEGAYRQLALFDALPAAKQRELLASVIADSPDAQTRAETLAESWRRGELSALERELGRGILADAELREALLFARNRAWARRIGEILEGKQRPFIAVGTGHLVGPEGLPALLEQTGYRVRRIQ